jgi:uncharacterized protein YndB with AHSA1/START domain
MEKRRNDGDGIASDRAATTLELPSDCEILITRTFPAPRRILFEALTRPEYVRRWWAPLSRGEMVDCEIDFRVGGTWRYVMRAHARPPARGEFEVGFSGVFLEIEAPDRIVQTEIFDPFPDAPATVELLLVEHAGTTTLTSRSRYPSKEIRDSVVRSGMEGGMRESMQQLAELVAMLASDR